VLVFVVMMICAVIIWIGMGKNPIDPAVVARV
jgi:Na+-translocating ferredoxin:NAD+ oxidoreductase RnfD subunit